MSRRTLWKTLIVIPVLVLAACEKPPEKSRRLTEEAKEAQGAGDEAKALTLLEQALTLDGSNELAFLIRAEIEATTDPARALERLGPCTAGPCVDRKKELMKKVLQRVKPGEADIMALYRGMLSLSVTKDSTEPDRRCAMFRLLAKLEKDARLRSGLGKKGVAALTREIDTLKPADADGDGLLKGYRVAKAKARAARPFSSCSKAESAYFGMEGQLGGMVSAVTGGAGSMPGSPDNRKNLFFHTLLTLKLAEVAGDRSGPRPPTVVSAPEVTGLRIAAKAKAGLHELAEVVLATGGRHKVVSREKKGEMTLDVRIDKKGRSCRVGVRLGKADRGKEASVEGGCRPDDIRRSLTYAVRKVAGVWTGAAPEPRPGPKAARVVNPRDGSVLLLVPAGAYVRGSAKYEVNLRGFYIDQHEVSVAQYRMCMRKKKCDRPGWIDEEGKPRLDDEEYEHYRPLIAAHQPIAGVTWEQARAYCRWAGKRLPTEAEWEKAARGTDRRKYPWGNKEPTCEMANFERDQTPCRGRSAPVISYSRYASPCGAVQMAGNVSEWVHDWHKKYYFNESPKNDPRGPRKGSERVTRGGSWFTSAAELQTTARDFAFDPSAERMFLGIRCARPL